MAKKTMYAGINNSPQTTLTATMVPEVVFAPGDATSGNYAPVAACVANGVKIFAVEASENAITLLTIVVWG